MAKKRKKTKTIRPLTELGRALGYDVQAPIPRRRVDEQPVTRAMLATLRDEIEHLLKNCEHQVSASTTAVRDAKARVEEMSRLHHQRIQETGILRSELANLRLLLGYDSCPQGPDKH